MIMSLTHVEWEDIKVSRSERVRTMTEQEKDIQELKIRVKTLEQYLATAWALPILGPATKAEYDQNVKDDLKAAGLIP